MHTITLSIQGRTVVFPERGVQSIASTANGCLLRTDLGVVLVEASVETVCRLLGWNVSDMTLKAVSDPTGLDIDDPDVFQD